MTKTNGRRAVLDIGSNSVRFVAYDGPPRAPMPIYNEKWPISLGSIVRDHGHIDDASMAHLLAGVDRFMALAAHMEISDIRAVATAAIRESANGQDFMNAAKARGLQIELLDGAQEAEAAAQGVLCNYPRADGYVADLGGGSLEIAHVEGGQVSGMVSLPLGTSVLIMMNDSDWQQAEQHIDAALRGAGIPLPSGKDLFLVGGAWRALAHLHQHMTDYPLSILSHYEIAPDTLQELASASGDSDTISSLSTIPDHRAAQLQPAAKMLQMLLQILEPRKFVSSALGIREGLLFGQLSGNERAEDPLLCCARFSGKRLGRMHFDGDRLFDWMQPLFAGSDSDADDARFRHAACLLADCAWNIHPDYRSAHALQIGIEGHWLGVNASGRALIARALWSAYGDSNNDRALLSQLAKRRDLRRADKWGLAIRLGMRIDGGTGAILDRCPIAIKDDRLSLTLPPGMAGNTIQPRLDRLAKGLGLSAEII